MKQQAEIKPIYWNLSHIWNEVAFKDNKPLQKRDYVYASEVGSPFCDRILKMKAVAQTNPPNNRSLRKFLAGNLIEHVTKQILIAAGVYKHDEVKIDATPYADCLDVHGRMDFKAGGFVDGELALNRLNDLNLPDYLYAIGNKIIEALDGKYLEERILELKAVSTFAMDKVERSKSAMPNHTMQGYHYQKNGGIQAAISYVCKDDCRMAQFDVNAETAEPIYRKDLEQITYYFRNPKKKVPIEPLAKFDDILGKFSKNLGVEYSPYLTMLYGFESPEAYRDSVKFVDKWNRGLNRYVLAETGATTPTGKAIVITSKNKEVRDEIEKAGYNFNEIIDCKIRLGAVEEEETE